VLFFICVIFICVIFFQQFNRDNTRSPKNEHPNIRLSIDHMQPVQSYTHMALRVRCRHDKHRFLQLFITGVVGLDVVMIGAWTALCKWRQYKGVPY